MKILHHIGLRVGEEERREFLDAGITLQSGITSFEIAEDDPRWQRVAPLLGRVRASDAVSTQFSAAERDRAKFLGLLSSWYHGYPEPSDDGSYKTATFDLAEYCEVCGIGWTQAAPFHMKKAPVWGRRSVLQLNWIFDEYFVKPDAWKAVFQPLGIGSRPVVLDKTGAEIESVVQLDIPQCADARLEGVAYDVCPQCGRKKYQYQLRGFYPAPADTSAAIFKSSQYFGSGRRAFRLVFVSNQLYRRITEAAIKGVAFYPCADY